MVLNKHFVTKAKFLKIQDFFVGNDFVAITTYYSMHRITEDFSAK